VARRPEPPSRSAAGAIDLESLVIQAGRYVWSLRCDVRVLDHGGGVASAGSVAVRPPRRCLRRSSFATAQVLLALLSHRRPEASVTADTGEVVLHSPSVREPLPLSLHHRPLVVTYALFEAERVHAVLDPSALEERACSGSLLAMLNVHRDVCALLASGRVAASPQLLQACVAEGALEVAKMLDIVAAALGRHVAERLRTRVRRHEPGAVHELGAPLREAAAPVLGGRSLAEEESEEEGPEATAATEAEEGFRFSGLLPAANGCGAGGGAEGAASVAAVPERYHALTALDEVKGLEDAVRRH